MKSEEYEQLLTDRFLNTQYSLWNALITFNALIISVISILFVINNNLHVFFVLWLFLSSSISVVLILLNYMFIKFTYQKIQSFDKDYAQANPQEISTIRKQYGNKFLKRHKWISAREYISMGIVFINIIVILLVIMSKQYNCP